MLTVRRAADSDARVLFEWRNDEMTRAASVSGSPVTWEDHCAWLGRVLGDRRRYLYLIEDGTTPIAMCRFDVADDGTAEVSINLGPTSRGRGLSSAILRAGIDRFRADDPVVPRLTATIRHDNVASSKLFRSLGFEQVSNDSEFGYFARID